MSDNDLTTLDRVIAPNFENLFLERYTYGLQVGEHRDKKMCGVIRAYSDNRNQNTDR